MIKVYFIHFASKNAVLKFSLDKNLAKPSYVCLYCGNIRQNKLGKGRYVLYVMINAHLRDKNFVIENHWQNWQKFLHIYTVII